MFDAVKVTPQNSDWVRHLCGIQLPTTGTAMKTITKQEAHEFKDRWEFVNNFIAHEIRNTPAEIKRDVYHWAEPFARFLGRRAGSP